MRRSLLLLGLLLAGAGIVSAQTVPPEARAELTPTGTLRAAINFGNPVLAQRDRAGGGAGGVSVALARALAERLNVPLTLIPFDAAGAVTDANKASGGHAWDVAFLAVDPVRGEEIGFTSPYVIIEGIYAVMANSPIRSNEEVDREGVRVSVGRGSAYDLYLTRALQRATLVRSGTSASAITDFASQGPAGGLDVLAGVGQPIRGFAATRPDVRVLPGRFMVIEQAMATPRGREHALAYLRRFVEEAKSSGLVARALADSNQPDAQVAPAAR
ncbi:transporter substrate-binding domain-containing protein [Muricoccus radiodurans]|uniref:transporter substrate-binding domain-containing protein n=1 Tax=Muricoccus radiodurans TaxID=2231721 RepID=UPI003CEC427F